MGTLLNIIPFIPAIALGILYGFAIKKLTKIPILLLLFMILNWVVVAIIIYFIRIVITDSIYERILIAFAISANFGITTFHK